MAKKKIYMISTRNVVGQLRIKNGQKKREVMTEASTVQTHCDSNDWLIGMQKVPNEAISKGLKILSIFCKNKT